MWTPTGSAAVESLLDYLLHATAAAGEHLETTTNTRRNFQPGELKRPDPIHNPATLGGPGWTPWPLKIMM